MRFFKYIISFLCLLSLLIFGGVVALAMDTELTTEELPEDRINTILESVNIRTLSSEPSKSAIDCFDVNENGLIAVGCSIANNKTVCIYTSDGVYQCGFVFTTLGDFYVELIENVLNIYLVRGDTAISINFSGEIESVREIQNTSANNFYQMYILGSTSRKIGDAEYIIRNDMGIFNIFASSYSQLTVKSNNGDERIIYDVNSTQLVFMIISVLGIAIFISVIVICVIRQSKKYRRNARLLL